VVDLPTPAKWALRLGAVAYVFFLVGWPVIMLAQRTFANGWDAFVQTFQDPDVTHALLVTLEISL
jgi:sulfate/thiosulfate transport system permease protein